MDKPTCTTDGCDSPLSAKGMCKPHYQQDYYRRTLGAEIATRLAAEALVPRPIEKACTMCSETKPLDGFHREKRNQLTGRSAVCRSCKSREYAENRAIVAARGVEYRRANKEAIRLRKRAEYAANVEIHRQKNADGHQRHRESRRAAAAARRSNPEYAAEASRRTREWRQSNPERARVQDLLRNKRLRAAGRIPFTQEQLAARIAYFGGRCWMCRGAYEHLDHVKPVALGGITALSNLRPACRSCNSLKRAQWFGPFELHRFIR